MAISYRKRGKQQLWDYRIFDSEKKSSHQTLVFVPKKKLRLKHLKLS